MNALTAVFLLILAAEAPPPAPTAAPSTRPSPEQLHSTAYEFLRAKQYQKAATPMEAAYRARPLAQQPRPLILNHALLDIALKQNAMRAVKDLREYLAGQEQPDEHAVNLLGAALEVAGRDERMQETELYTAAEKQLEQSVKQLEQSRPGEHKWGNQWKTEAEYKELHAKRLSTREAYRVARQQARKLLNAAKEAAAKVDRLEEKGPGGRKKVVQKRTAALEAAYRESAEAEKQYSHQKGVVEAARKNLFEPAWSTELEPIEPSRPDARRRPPATTQPK